MSDTRTPTQRAVTDVKRTLTEGMWADGWPERDIKDALGLAHGSQYVTVRRAQGWDLPRRYPDERVNASAAARWTTEPRAVAVWPLSGLGFAYGTGGGYDNDGPARRARPGPVLRRG